MAYDDFLNKDKGLRGGAMDAPDLQVRIAQAKIAANAANLLTKQEWRRLAERQRLEQESLPMAMTGSEQATRARAAMTSGLPRFSQQELMQANMPGTVPAEQEFRVRNIPGRGESTVVQGVEIRGGPAKDSLPVPEEGYGYIQTPTGYLSTTPYGMERGSTPVLGDTLATEPAPETQVAQAAAPAPRVLSRFEQELAKPVFQPRATALIPSTVSQFQQELAKPPIQLQAPEAPKTIEELLPSLRGTPARANEAVADWMRGTFYGATNIVRPSMWESVTTPQGAAAAIFQPEKSPAYLGQLKSRLAALTDKTAPAAVRLQNEINRLTQAAPRMETLVSDILGISTMRAPKVSPAFVANELLGMPAPAIATPTASATPTAFSPTTVQAVLPPPMQPSPEMEMFQAEQQFAPPEAAAPRGLAYFTPAQAPQTYRPPQFTAPRFDASAMMKQPSVSESLAFRANTAAQQRLFEQQKFAAQQAAAARKQLVTTLSSMAALGVDISGYAVPADIMSEAKAKGDKQALAFQRKFPAMQKTVEDGIVYEQAIDPATGELVGNRIPVRSTQQLPGTAKPQSTGELIPAINPQTGQPIEGIYFDPATKTYRNVGTPSLAKSVAEQLGFGAGAGGGTSSPSAEPTKFTPVKGQRYYQNGKTYEYDGSTYNLVK